MLIVAVAVFARHAPDRLRRVLGIRAPSRGGGCPRASQAPDRRPLALARAVVKAEQRLSAVGALEQLPRAIRALVAAAGLIERAGLR